MTFTYIHIYTYIPTYTYIPYFPSIFNAIFPHIHRVKVQADDKLMRKALIFNMCTLYTYNNHISITVILTMFSRIKFINYVINYYYYEIDIL